jgi:hypothetical protein
MDNQRRNFKCVFNPYVTDHNKDAVIMSIINQFEGYYAEPEVTQVSEGFILTLTIGDNLSPTMVRDKILWNQFVESVTAADAIRKIQILRLPKAGKENEGTVGGFGPDGSDSGVNEVDGSPHMEFKIDMGDRPDGPTLASVHYADPTGDIVPKVFGPGSEEDEHIDENVRSDATNMHAPTAKILGVSAFKRISFQSDTGGSFTLNKLEGFQSVNDSPDPGPLHERATPGTGIGGGAPISGASWYVTQPGNEQGTELGKERNRGDTSSAPLGIGASVVAPELNEEDKSQGIKGVYGDTLDVLGVGDHPIGGASYGSYFGLNDDYYNYEGDVDGYDI